MGMTPVAIVLSVITMGCLAPIQQPPPAVYAVLTEGDKSFVLHTQSLEFTVLNVGRSKHVTATNLVVFKSDRLKGPALAAEVAGIPTRPFLPIAIAGDARGARWTFASQILQSLHASLPPWSSYETYARAWARSLNVPFETYTSSARAGRVPGTEIDVLSACDHGRPCTTYIRFQGRDFFRTEGRVHGLLELEDGRRYLVILDASYAVELFEVCQVGCAGDLGRDSSQRSRAAES